MLFVLGADERSVGELGEGEERFPEFELVLWGDAVLFSKAGAPRGVGFGDGDEADLIGVGAGVEAVHVGPALSRADEEGGEGGGRRHGEIVSRRRCIIENVVWRT